jgi:alginate O-acetyltransferase complex protein AlgI
VHEKYPMTFQDPRFLLFFFIVFVIYWILDKRSQNIFLVCVSYLFYCFIDSRFALLLFAQSIITFFLVLQFDKSSKWGKPAFIFAIFINILILLYFKYFNFFIENINHLFGFFHFNPSLTTLKIILPIGISFYTFQNISYIIDVRRKDTAICTSLINYCLYINFFPKLLAGPIERASNLLNQIEKNRSFDMDKLSSGVVLFLWGFFQKSVIADNIGYISNKVFLLEQTNFCVLCAGAFAYTIQIYADFSGYTDMARGLGRLLGFELVKNFNNPYFSRSPADFWRRWHMSFSQWIRDYIYIPLGGSRVSPIRHYTNLFVAFFFTGLWHGAAWNFVIWGLYYWVLYIVFRVWKKICPDKIYNFRFNFIISTIIMFILINIGWVMFRETDLNYLYKYLTVTIFNWNPEQLPLAVYLILYSLIFSSPLIIFSAYTFIFDESNQDMFINSFYKKVFICVVLFIAILPLKAANDAQFIYFNF